MQFTQIISKKILSFRISQNLLKVLVFAGLSTYFWELVNEKNILGKLFSESTLQYILDKPVCFLLVCCLLPVNWGLETLKWKLLVSKKYTFSFKQALEGTLTGLSLGLATPYGLGDYLGRVLQVKEKDRNTLIAALFLSNAAQFLATLFFGVLACIYFLREIVLLQQISNNTFLFLGIGMFACLSLYFFRYRVFSFFKNTILEQWSALLSKYQTKEMLIIFLLSLLRYLVFSAQFVLLLFIFGVSSNFLLLAMGVFFTFLVKSVIPTFFELGVREVAAITFFTRFSLSPEQVLFASLLLWTINICIPAMLGSLLVFNLKFSLR